MMNEEIPQLLKNLQLRKIAEIVEGELVAARKASPSYSELLALPASRGVARSTGEAAASTRQSGQPAGGLASGLLLKAVENGYRGLFIKAQDLFDEMSFHRRSGFAQTLAALGSSRSDRGRRTWVPQSASRADESFLQTHGRALPAQAHDHHHH